MALVLTCALMAACAARPANPVKMVQSGDEMADCQKIEAEMVRNNEQIRQLANIDSDVESGNVVAFLLWAPLIDFSKTEEIEVNALLDRNRHLNRLRQRKACGD